MLERCDVDVPIVSPALSFYGKAKPLSECCRGIVISVF